MHYFKNFKSFVDAKINLMRPVTILIGKNGSGKTNVIEGVELIAKLASGSPLGEIADVGRGLRAFEVRGGLRDCTRIGADYFELGFSASVAFTKEPEPVCYEIKISAHKIPYVKEELLQVGKRTIYHAVANDEGDSLRVGFNCYTKSKKKSVFSTSADCSILNRFFSLASFSEGSNGFHVNAAKRVVAVVARHFRSSFVFNPNPQVMRAYEQSNQAVLRKDGGNISAILLGLKNGDNTERDALAGILSAIVQLPDEFFVDFEFVETRQGDVLFGLKRNDGVLIDARLLSDGTLRALGILTALECAPIGSRVVIEEIDNGIHASRVKILLDAIWSASKRRQLNVLVTTHNVALLNTLNLQQLRDVVACTYDTAISASVLLRLSEVPRLESLVMGGKLGDIVAREIIEQHLSPGFEDQQRSLVLNWLESIK